MFINLTSVQLKSLYISKRNVELTKKDEIYNRYILRDFIFINMEVPAVFFNPIPNQTYKIVSVMDVNKVFTLQNDTNNLILSEYTGILTQKFQVFNNNFKYAFASLAKNMVLHIQKDYPNDGGVLHGDPVQYPSSFFEIVPVSKGEWANKACFIKTFAGKAVDIKGGKIIPNVDICAWGFSGGSSQMWAILPSDQNLQEGTAQLAK